MNKISWFLISLGLIISACTVSASSRFNPFEDILEKASDFLNKVRDIEAGNIKAESMEELDALFPQLASLRQLDSKISQK